MSTTKSISGIIGKGSIRHNNRDFYAANIDQARTKNNIIFKKQDIHDAYQELFGKALEEYNAKQKRKDRRIMNYYEHIRTSKQEKLFYEVIFQIGDMKDTSVGTPEGDRAAVILSEFYNKFVEENQHIYVFNAVIHMDEATPHLHIDFIPVATGNKRGLSTKNSLSKALEQQGFKSEGKLNTCTKLWIDNEKQRLAECMAEHGIEHEIKGIKRGNLSTEEFKLQQRMEEVAALEEQIITKTKQLSNLDSEIDNKQSELDRLSVKENKIKDLNKIKTENVMFSDKIKLKRDDYYTLLNTSKKYYSFKNTNDFLKSQIKVLEKENSELKSTVSEQKNEIYKLQNIRERMNINLLKREITELKSLVEKLFRFIEILNLKDMWEQFIRSDKKRNKDIER